MLHGIWENLSHVCSLSHLFFFFLGQGLAMIQDGLEFPESCLSLSATKSRALHPRRISLATRIQHDVRRQEDKEWLLY